MLHLPTALLLALLLARAAGDCTVATADGYVSTELALASPAWRGVYRGPVPVGLVARVVPALSPALQAATWLCLRLDAAPALCAPVDAAAEALLGTPLVGLAPGAHTLHAWLEAEADAVGGDPRNGTCVPGRRCRLDCNLAAHDSTRFWVGDGAPPGYADADADADADVDAALAIEAPARGATVAGPAVQVRARFPASHFARVLGVALAPARAPDDDRPAAAARTAEVAVAAGEGSAAFELADVAPGIHRLALTLGGAATAAAEFRAVAAEPTANRTRTVVTAADEAYFARVANLVGSVHFWEPGATVELFDLGLSARSLAEARRWANVRVVAPDWDALPAHVKVARLVGWKTYAVLDALERYATVLWLDANYELRRPLDELWGRLGASGHFLTVAGHAFPTSKTVRPQTLKTLGCSAPVASMDECTSAVMGAARGSAFHRDVLLPMHACAMVEACLYPPDSVGNANQRRDQSALNAALCAARGAPAERPAVECRHDLRWWSWSGHGVLEPTEDPAAWNELALFSRRDEPVKPYLASIVTADGAGSGGTVEAVLEHWEARRAPTFSAN